jgi:LysR family glycine cleavage system transcriptional activator
MQGELDRTCLLDAMDCRRARATRLHSIMNLIHNKTMRPLPPFDALVAFDAVLRLGSMTAAAEELGITQSAVSHRLRRLEAFVGTELLLRRRAGLAPTPAGTALAEGLGDIFDGMADLRERCRIAASPARLRIGLSAALAQHWLVRRLPDFSRRHPGIEVELVIFTTRAQAEARGGDMDLRILWVKPEEARNSSTQKLLFREQVFPVCAPSVLKAPLRSPAKLADLPLLYKSAESGQGAEWEWNTWFRRLGITAKPKPRLRFEEIGLAIAAALEGAGVALGRSLLVHDALRDGRLVRPLGEAWSLPSAKVHLARWPARLSTDLRLRSFVSWLAEQAERTVAETAVAPTGRASAR